MARAFNQSLNAQANALRIKITLQQSPSPLPNYLNSEQSEKVYLQDPFAEYIIATPKPSNKAVSNFFLLINGNVVLLIISYDKWSETE